MKNVLAAGLGVRPKQQNRFHRLSTQLCALLTSNHRIHPVRLFLAFLLKNQIPPMQAIFNGTVLANSDDIVMMDGNPYFPRGSMAKNFFRESDHTTVCGWKGTARYWDVVVEDQVFRNAVKAYDTPKPDAKSIRERFAFYWGEGSGAAMKANAVSCKTTHY